MRAGEKLRWARIAAAALCLAVLAAAFSGLSALAARAPHLEFAPALLRSCAAFTLGALATVVLILLFSWLFGRFYCACLCPLGIWQDLVGRASRRKAHPVADYACLRYLIGGVTFGVLAGGWTLPFLLLDPYSNFGRIVAGGFAVGGIVPLVVITLLAVWKKRIYCTAVCPVGTLLGLFSRFGVFKLRFTDKCVKCGLCVRSCPSGCIDLERGTIDNERCVRCLNCLAVCRVGGVEYTARRGGKSAPAPEAVPDVSRRDFLLKGGVLVAGAAAGYLAARGNAVYLAARALAGTGKSWGGPAILPPGAGDPLRFGQKCTACQLCTANCPAGIIVPARGGDGKVRLDLSRGACRYDCNKCSTVCPTGALAPLTLEEKRRTGIAEAKFDPGVCIVCQELKKCGRCAAACPTGAITLRGKLGVPRLNVGKCIGCGACQAACPAKPYKAMSVHFIAEQRRLES